MHQLEVKEMRQRLKLTQAEFARLLGVTVTTVSRWECGVTRVTAKGGVALLQLLERALQHAAPNQIVEQLRFASDDLRRIEVLMDLGRPHSTRPGEQA
jgi:transcriptional regulator with XRE-family HTH domain